MPVLAKFEKQPADVLDYDVDFRDWLAAGDAIVGATASADPSDIVVESVTHANGVVRVFLSGGVHGRRYKITVTVETVAQRTKQVEFTVKVKEI